MTGSSSSKNMDPAPGARPRREHGVGGGESSCGPVARLPVSARPSAAAPLAMPAQSLVLDAPASSGGEGEAPGPWCGGGDGRSDAVSCSSPLSPPSPPNPPHCYH